MVDISKFRLSENVEDRRPGSYRENQLYTVTPFEHQLRFENAINNKRLELALQIAKKRHLTPLGMEQLILKSPFNPDRLGGIPDDKVNPYFYLNLEDLTSLYQKTKDVEPALSGKAMNVPIRRWGWRQLDEGKDWPQGGSGSRR